MRKNISLNGDWLFAYTKDKPTPENTEFPSDDKYEVKISVPAYWDDCKSKLKYAKFWSRGVNFNPTARRIEEFPLGGLKPPDASLPYILGTGWYKRSFFAQENWQDKCINLCIGGAMLDVWVWVNGEYAGTYYSCGKPVEFEIEKFVKYGSENEIILAVSNLRNDRIGCSIRGYKGKSAGINRAVSISISDGARIKECYIRTNEEMTELFWDISLRRKNEQSLTLLWSIYSPDENKEIASGKTDAADDGISFITDTFNMKPWSDRTPKLYEINLTLKNGDAVLDTFTQNYGMRYAKRDGLKILVNNTPTFLRGTTDHAYFAETCTVPNDISYYMRTLKALKEAGFNWMRFHTTIPPEECMEAADRLGMYIQAETQNGFEDEDFVNMLLLCRKHPSVILYCCGNEVPIDEKIGAQMERMGKKCKELVPDCLYDPMEALLNVECLLDETLPGYTKEPYEHNAIMLENMRKYSDVFATGVWVFSYHSLYPDVDMINKRLSIYKRPCLIHEAGIFDTYLNLDLEKRYEGTRIGKELFSAVRKYAEEMGVLDMTPTYYHNSCRWMKLLMKFALEKSRRCPSIAGYDFLGAIDCHWHRSGYATGVMNEFYEIKSGFTFKELQQFNGESIIVSDAGHKRSFFAGETIPINLYASLYGNSDMESGVLCWTLTDDKNEVRKSGTVDVGTAKVGELTELACVDAGLNEVCGTGEHIKLNVMLTGGAYSISNEWDFWVFNRKEEVQSESYRVVSSLTAEDVEYMSNGGRIILLGSGPFPGLPITFQITPGGRTGGNSATVVHDHPLMRSYPHDGFCDWQFAPMFHDGGAILFNEPDIPFKPIVEIVSTYKVIRKQAAIFEIKIGSGGMLVCGLNVGAEDASAKALLHRMKEYIISDEFNPETVVTEDYIIELMENRKDIVVDFTTDECYDTGGYIEV